MSTEAVQLPTTTSKRAYKPQPILLLIGMMVVILLQLWQTRTEPLERDMPAYAMVGHEVLHGRQLYSDIFDQKPPAPYATYALSELIFGFGRPTLFYMVVLASWITLWGVYAAGKALMNDVWAGVGAAGLYTLVCADVLLQANQPNTEVFINACMVWGFAILAHFSDRVIPWRAALLAGLIFALGTLYKSNVIVIPLLLAGAYVFCLRPAAGSRRRVYAAMSLFCAVIFAVWLLITLYFAGTGRFDAFYYAMVTYNRSYAGNPLANVRHALHPSYYLLHFVRSLLILPLLGGAGALFVFKTPQWRQWQFLIAYLLGAFVAFALPGRYYMHYYQMFLPPLCLVAGCTIPLLLRQRSGVRIAGGLLIAFTLLVLARRAAVPFYLSPNQVSQIKYSNEFIEAELVAQRINQVLKPEEIYFDASTSPQIYFASKRPLQCGVFYTQASIGGARAERFADRVLAELNAKPPELLTMEDGDIVNPRLKTWILQHYEPLPLNQQVVLPDHAPEKDRRFTLMMKREGALSKRIQANLVPPSK